jgi:hypothetical protein
MSKDKERIEVGNIYCYAGEGSRHLQITIKTDDISKEKLDEIKSSIEQVLNDEFISIYGNYTQKYLDEQIEKAFNAGKNIFVEKIKEVQYETYQDYKQSLLPIQ